MGREEAFNLFKRDYPLQGKMQGLNMFKAKEEAGNIRVQINTVIQSNNNDTETQEFLIKLRNELDVKRTEYRDSYNSLKELKSRVEHLQHSLELVKMRLVQDFESWWNQ
ncbi:unnamed protein product [Heterobilharzia americana]|nr:unnamed protein product [Heterobilharzia americana]